MGEDLTVTTRIRNGWLNVRYIMLFLTSRASSLEMKGRSNMIYGSDSKILLANVGLKFEE